MNDADRDMTVRELSREIVRLTRAIEALAAEFKQEFSTLRSETVRHDVYIANRATDDVERSDMERRIEDMEKSNRALKTAFTGMLLSVMGGVMLFLILQGLSPGAGG